MATTTYVLLHDGGKRNRSILTQLGIRNQLKFVSTADPINPRNLLASHHLVQIRMSTEGAKYIPALTNTPVPPSHVSFGQWWERDVIFRSGANESPRVSLTRKRLIYALRNKEGGSHFDEVIDDPGYVALAKTPHWVEHLNGKERPMPDLETACMRQVAFELLETFRLGRLIP